MRDAHFILGPDHKLVVVDLLTWAKWFEKGDRIVEQTGVGDHWVSTVFLGIDHQFGKGPPLLFETMVFKRKADGQIDLGGEDQLRYATWDDAVAGHQATVKRLRQRLAITTDRT